MSDDRAIEERAAELIARTYRESWSRVQEAVKHQLPRQRQAIYLDPDDFADDLVEALAGAGFQITDRAGPDWQARYEGLMETVAQEREAREALHGLMLTAQEAAAVVKGDKCLGNMECGLREDGLAKLRARAALASSSSGEETRET